VRSVKVVTISQVLMSSERGLVNQPPARGKQPDQAINNEVKLIGSKRVMSFLKVKRSASGNL